MNPLGDKVRAERLRRGESVRTAATRGKISNTWWGKFEDGVQPLTDGLSEAVAKSFKWPETWAEDPTQPTSVDSQLAQLRAEVADQAERLTALAHQFAHLQQQIEAGARASRAAHQAQTTEAQSQGAPS